AIRRGPSQRSGTFSDRAWTALSAYVYAVRPGRRAWPAAGAARVKRAALPGLAQPLSGVSGQEIARLDGTAPGPGCGPPGTGHPGSTMVRARRLVRDLP